MRELDILLQAYLEQRYRQAGAREQAAFRKLLELEDPVLMNLLLAGGQAGEGGLADVVTRILLTDRHR